MGAQQLLVDFRRHALQKRRLIVGVRLIDADRLHASKMRLHVHEIRKHEQDRRAAAKQMLGAVLAVCFYQRGQIRLSRRCRFATRRRKFHAPEVLDHMAAGQVADRILMMRHPVAPVAAVSQIKCELVNEVAVVGALQRIFGKHLPVATETHLLHASGQLDLTHWRAIEDQIEEFLGLAQMLVKAHSLGAQAAENQSAIGGQPGYRNEPEILLAQRRVVSVVESRRQQVALV